MSTLVVCPDCKRKLNVPETAAGKTIRCPSCKALLPSVPERVLDIEAPDADTPSRVRAVKITPSPRTAPVPPRVRPPRDEEPEDDIESADARPIDKKSSRNGRSIRKKSSAGLIIGLTIGGVLLLVVFGSGLLLLFTLRKTVSSLEKTPTPSLAKTPTPPLVKENVPQAEWQPFTPPGGNCSVLMPGMPQHQPMTTLGITVNKYLLSRAEEKAFFVVAFANFGPDPVAPNALELVANAERDHMMRTLNGRVTSETAITLGNLPGREFQISTLPQGTLIERFYLTKIGGKHRLYMVAAAGDTFLPTTGDVVRFFDSFQIDASAVPPSFVAAGVTAKPLQLPHVVHPPLRNRPLPPIHRPVPPSRRIPRR